MNKGIASIRDAVEAKDKENTWLERNNCSNQVSELEELMVTDFSF
jgi:hypothetical protein